MIDSYKVLGVSPTASVSAIRAAYLAKMKVLHPDLGGPTIGEGPDASLVTFAYWQLRDPVRRAEHDRNLLGVPAARSIATKERAKTSLVRARENRRRRQRRIYQATRARLRELRTVIGVAAFALSAVVIGIAWTLPQNQARSMAMAASPPVEEMVAGAERRRIDPEILKAAASEFKTVLRKDGPNGPRLYARQCLLQLSSRPSLFLLDHCIAFDVAAAKWERDSQEPATTPSRYFEQEQRIGRYLSAARGLKPGEVRHAIVDEARQLAAK
jgi:hypothetical protein